MSKKPEPEQPAQPEPKFLRSNRFRGGYEMKEFKPRLDRSALNRRIVVIGSIVTLVLTVLLVAAALLACGVPAWRAARASAALALR